MQATRKRKRIVGLAALRRRASILFENAMTGYNWETVCKYCEGIEEGDPGDHSFVHKPDCPLLLISDFCRLGE